MYNIGLIRVAESVFGVKNEFRAVLVGCFGVVWFWFCSVVLHMTMVYECWTWKGDAGLVVGPLCYGLWGLTIMRD